MGSPNRRIPTGAGILMLIAGAFNVLWLIGVFTHVLDVKALLRATAVISPLPYLILDVGFGGNNLMASMLALIFLLGIILSIAGGWLTLKRKNRNLSFMGAAGACICAPLLGIAAVIILVLSGNRPLNRKNLNQGKT
jgi:hypothetical protein